MIVFASVSYKDFRYWIGVEVVAVAEWLLVGNEMNLKNQN